MCREYKPVWACAWVCVWASDVFFARGGSIDSPGHTTARHSVHNLQLISILKIMGWCWFSAWFYGRLSQFCHFCDFILEIESSKARQLSADPNTWRKLSTCWDFWEDGGVGLLGDGENICLLFLLGMMAWTYLAISTPLQSALLVSVSFDCFGKFAFTTPFSCIEILSFRFISFERSRSIAVSRLAPSGLVAFLSLSTWMSAFNFGSCRGWVLEDLDLGPAGACNAPVTFGSAKPTSRVYQYYNII